ncbi:MAG: DctP family TRAP transporter solute-binding subunit [Deltaproteobacteria bacterium]|nr:DctP family TRAP transporter solute-binding subunit [Deltaproteobacteria bacterium]
MKNVWLGLTVFCLFFIAMAAPGMAAYKAEYRMSVVVEPTSPWGQGAQMFADLVKKRTDGRIVIKPYFRGQLYAGKQTNEFLLLQQGVADFALASTINWSTTVKELNLFSLPFLFHNEYKAVDALEAGEVGRKIFRILADKGAIALGWGENGFREITNSKRAIHTPEDLQGLKIRVVGAPIFTDIFKSLGADPVAMNWGEVLSALQSGTVDGQENPVASITIPYRLWEVNKYITFWHYAIDPLIFAASKETWDALDRIDREIISKAAREAASWQKKAAREGLTDSAAFLDILKKNGMEITLLTPAQFQAFKVKTKPVYDKWASDIGIDLVRAAEKAVKSVEAKKSRKTRKDAR